MYACAAKWSPVGESNAVSSVYKTAASPAMLTGQKLVEGTPADQLQRLYSSPPRCGASWWSRTTYPFLTKELHIRMCFAGKLEPPDGVEPSQPAFGGPVPESPGGDMFGPVDRSRAYASDVRSVVPEFPRANGMWLMG